MNNCPAMTEEQRQELIRHNRAKVDAITPQFLKEVSPVVKRHLQSEIDSAKILIVALTAPPVPVPRVPDGWIKCSERYPAPHEWVLVYAKWANQQVICWDHITSKWTDFYEQNYHKEMFTHWMPLPQPPETSNEQ